jgi:hypothetical protein
MAFIWPASRLAAPLAALAAALLFAVLPAHLLAGGWWPDMAGRARITLPVAALAWALLITLHSHTARVLATMAALFLAGFALAFGIFALDNGGPVPGFVALKSGLAGIAILATLALTTPARRPAALLLLAALLAAAALATTHWAPAIPAAGLLA